MPNSKLDSGTLYYIASDGSANLWEGETWVEGPAVPVAAGPEPGEEGTSAAWSRAPAQTAERTAAMLRLPEPSAQPQWCPAARWSSCIPCRQSWSPAGPQVPGWAAWDAPQRCSPLRSPLSYPLAQLPLPHTKESLAYQHWEPPDMWARSLVWMLENTGEHRWRALLNASLVRAWQGRLLR